MKLRIPLLAVVVALMSTGCTRYFVVKDKYDTVKKVALVQHVINPNQVFGTSLSDEARQETAAANWEVFAKEMGANYQVIPLAEMAGNAGYTGAGGKAEWEHFATAKGAMIFSTDLNNVMAATIAPDVATKLCEALGVDAVAVAYETWGQDPYALGFKAHSKNLYTINIFDKSGARVWGDVAQGISDEGFATPGGIISTDVANYTLNNKQAYTAALKTVNEHIAAHAHDAAPAAK